MSSDSAPQGSDRAPVRPADVLDLEVVEMLREVSGLGDGDDVPDLFGELVAMFAAEAPERLRELREAVAQGSAEQVHQTAHALKGNAAQMGLVEVRDTSLGLEELGRADQLELDDGRGAARLLDDLERAIQRALVALAALQREGA